MEKKNNDLKEFQSVFEKYDKILVSGHKNPDGDCIGSTIAIGLYLEELGKNVSLYIKDMPPEYKILRGMHLFTSTPDESYDLVVLVDCADDTRFEVKSQVANAKETINMDHHVNNPCFATYNYIDEGSSSTAEIIYDMFQVIGYDVNKAIAEAIYTGIISDTGLFQNRNTTSKTYEVVSRLMTKNIDFNRIIAKLFFNKTYTEMKLLGKAIDNSELHFDNKVIISTLTRDEISKLNAKPNETSNIIATLRQVDGVKISAFIYEPIPRNVKVSLRCDIPYSVFEIANALGGGGHVLASGVIIKNKPIEEVKQLVLNLAKEQIERYEN